MKEEVVLKTWSMLESEYGKDSHGDINTKMHRFTRSMETAVPTHRHIELNNGVWLANGTRYSITPEMILCPAFKPGEMVEVRDGDDEDWQQREFGGIVFRQDDSFYANGVRWKQIRKIEENPSVEIPVKIDGKESTLYISEETLLKLRKASEANG